MVSDGESDGEGGFLVVGAMRTSNTTDLETSTDLGGQLALGPAQHDVQELLLSRDGGDVLPGRLHDGRSGGWFFLFFCCTTSGSRCKTRLLEARREMANSVGRSIFFSKEVGGVVAGPLSISTSVG